MSWGLGTEGSKHRRFCAEDWRMELNEALSGVEKAVEKGIESSELRLMHW